jgi:heterodisulfide reductase subunit A-like polyferredoxin
LCTACETCLERCPVTAISIDEFAMVNKQQCIGCGLCVGSCPEEAIALQVDPDNKLPPATLGRLEKEIKAGQAP